MRARLYLFPAEQSGDALVIETDPRLNQPFRIPVSITVQK
jgi:hypothetical protein